MSEAWRPLRVAVQMDPIETISIEADSTFALMLEAQARGHALWHYEVRHLSLREGVQARARRREDRLSPVRDRLRSSACAGDHYRFGELRCSILPRWTSC